MQDPFNLERFVAAQDAVMESVRRELGAGRKQTHWMWFVFPQLRALGRSATALRYGIGSLAEARAYLAHPRLGPRLRECTQLVLDSRAHALEPILGRIDALKFGSSITLFARAAPAEPVFAAALERFCAGRPDPLTIELLEQAAHE